MESTNEIVVELQKEMLQVLLVKFYINVGWVDYLGGKGSPNIPGGYGEYVQNP